MASTFKRLDAVAGATRTQIYPAAGSVSAGVTAIIFSGVITNIDSSTRVDHTITVEVYNGVSYTPIFKDLPVAYGGTQPLPKIVLQTGENLWITGDAGSVLQGSMSVVERS